MLKRWLPFVLIAVGLGPVAGSAVLWRASADARRPAPDRLPVSLAGLALSDWSEGPAALAEIERMHAEGFPFEAAAIGHYGSSEQAVLWVAQLASEKAALEMADAMSRRIAEVNSPFRATGQRSRTAGVIRELEGVGQKHFYYSSGSNVIWLGADPAFAEQALQDTLEVYP